MYLFTAGMDIGLTGLQAAQSAINVTGQNITNINTPGYARQRVNLETGHAIQINKLQFGLGVNVRQVQAIRDHFLDLQLTQTITRQFGSQTRYEGLENIASLFVENGESGFGIELQRFFQSFEELAARPEDLAVRTNVITRAQTWIAGMQSRYKMIEDKRAEANKAVASIAIEVNTLASQIARLNKEIECEYPKGSDNNSRNQRQALVDKLGELVGIHCYEDSLGRLTITVENGIPLVSGSRSYAMVTNDLNGDGQYKVQIEIGNEAGIPPAIPAEGIIDVTDVIKNGKMGGMLDLRDNLLPEYMHNLDQLAAGVVMQVNLLHATGYGLDGSTGLSFFVGSNDYNNNTQTGNNPVTGLPWGIDSTNNFANMVKNLNVNVAIGGNPQMNIVGDPRSVAAADVANASGNNEIARQLAELQTKDGTVIVPDGLGGNIFKGPFSEFITGVANTVGNQALKFKSGANTDENIRVALETQRDSLSAVDMDEEATNLIVFQRSYQACSRFISVINQLTDQLINNFGR